MSNMDANQAHQITKELMMAIITSNKPVALQGDYVEGICQAYKQIYETIRSISGDSNV